MNIEQHRKRTEELKQCYRPEFFRLKDASDRERFYTLLNKQIPFLHDEIEGQLKELIKIRHPAAPLSDSAIAARIQEYSGGEALENYGVWVYYPWANRMVHLLDEDQFIEARTSRNRYKITADEQSLLAQKKVGVIGLSVGQSVAISMAMERSFGEIRLADFDELELTNLNRIRSGNANLGLKKVIAVAREIAEIDPWLKVTIFPEGLHSDNIDDFYTAGGRLDAIIDECDGVDIKILCRQKAKALGIPVLMEASDRCCIDIERFDLEPSRPLLHGLIDHLDLSRLPFLKSNEEKIPYLAPMVGVDTMSVRLKASVLEVGHSITTWPQLASAVVMGGGALADCWRRIALDQFQESGRYFIDMEELVGKQRPETRETIPDQPPPLETTFMAHAVETYLKAHDSTSDQRVDQPGEQQIGALVEAAAKAPSGGNSQPWKWAYKKGRLFLFLDRREAWSYMNVKDSAAYIALGAAIENLLLTAGRMGISVKQTNFPMGSAHPLTAVFSFQPKVPGTTSLKEEETDIAGPDEADITKVNEADLKLADFIDKRHTNRKVTDRVTLPPESLKTLREACSGFPEAELTFIEHRDELLETGRIIGICDHYRIMNPESNYDFTRREIRWTAEEAAERRNGIEAASLELSESELIGLKFIRDQRVTTFLSTIGGGQLLKNASIKNACSASAFGLLSIPEFSNPAFLKGGMAAQRLWLKATQSGLAFHPMNVPIAYFLRLKHDPGSLPQGSLEEIRHLYARFLQLFRQDPGREELYLFRVFKAEAPAILPYRKRIDEILTRL